MASLARRNNRDTNFWPGYVDALATLLMVIIFVLMVFIVAQFYLTHALSGRDDALAKLNQQISELADLLALEQQTNADLRLNISQLTKDLQTTADERNALASQVQNLLNQRDSLESRMAGLVSDQASLRARIVELEAEMGKGEEQLLSAISERDALLAKLRAVQEEASIAVSERDVVAAELADARQEIQVTQEKLTLRLAELESLRRDIEVLKTVRTELENEVALLATARKDLEKRLALSAEEKARLEESKASLEDQKKALDLVLMTTRNRAKQLEARLADQQEQTSLAQKEVADREIRLQELLSQYDLSQLQLTEEQKISAEARAQVALLNQQLAAVRQQLANLEAALEAVEALAEQQQVQIVDLGSRLNAALATKVQELSRFRSEFFGKLREVLGERKDIKVVGDRFVFQSEVLFKSGSADIGAQGKQQLSRLSATLKEIAANFPPDINWVLAVEGHTDRIPIFNDRFRNNWELSSGRAISVVEYLIETGIPANRLAATGYGEFQPLDEREDEIALRRNRRIEMKLTQR